MQAILRRRRAYSVERAFLALRLALYRLAHWLKLGEVNWMAAGLLLATPIFAVSVVTLVAVTQSLFWSLLPGTVVYLFLAAGIAFGLRPARGSEYGAEITTLRDKLAACKRRLDLANRELSASRQSLQRLLNAKAAQGEVEEATRAYDYATRRLEEHRKDVRRVDWRSLRGIDFEQFLQRAFELLGYATEITKKSGDQGVDLIVTGRGRRIAIQAKGYSGSVGNGSVQEVFAGQRYYMCSECAVVTNSVFTSSAIDLARAVNCTLIDGARIVDLIEGRIF
jgi:hypothetical protein